MLFILGQTAPVQAPASPHSALEKPAEAVRGIAEELRSVATDYGLKVVGALVFLLIAWILAGWASRLALRAMQRAKVDITLSKFLATSARWAVITLAIIACLGIFGIQTASFAAVIGAAGLAIGLAFQGALSNLAAGAMLLIFRPFKVGDSVVVAGQAGTVDEIELFTTQLDTADNRRIILPNSAIFGAVIENQSYHPHRRATINICLSYDADVNAARRLLADTLKSIPGQLPEKAPEVALTRLGPSGMDWEARLWAPKETLGAVQESAAVALKNALDDAGIMIVVPPFARRAGAGV